MKCNIFKIIEGHQEGPFGERSRKSPKNARKVNLKRAHICFLLVLLSNFSDKKKENLTFGKLENIIIQNLKT